MGRTTSCKDGAAPSVRFAATSPIGVGEACRRPNDPTGNRTGARAGSDGFTLIEALVAFAILACASLVIHRSLVQSRAGLAAVADREAAEWVARDLLAAPLTRAEIVAGGRSGSTADGRRWQTRVGPLDLPMPERAAAPGGEAAQETDSGPRWLPFRERITIETGRGTPISIETVKLGPVD